MVPFSDVVSESTCGWCAPRAAAVRMFTERRGWCALKWVAIFFSRLCINIYICVCVLEKCSNKPGQIREKSSREGVPKNGTWTIDFRALLLLLVCVNRWFLVNFKTRNSTVFSYKFVRRLHCRSQHGTLNVASKVSANNSKYIIGHTHRVYLLLVSV